MRESMDDAAKADIGTAEAGGGPGTPAAPTAEDRFRALATAGALSVYRMSPEWRLMYQLDSDTLAVTSEATEDWADHYILPEDRERVGAAIREAIATGTIFELEHRVRLADGSIGWVLSRAVPLRGQNGRIVEWFGAARDVSDRKRTEEALRDSEAKYRRLFDSMDEAYAVVEVLKDETGRWADFRFLEVNPAFMEHTAMPYPVGRTATELLGTPNPRWAALYGQALDSGTALRVEETEPALGRVFDLNIFALDRAQNRVAVLFTNVTERRRSLNLQDTLLAELQHRVRNIMAVIRSIVRRSHDEERSAEDYVQHLEGRIAALARTQALLTRRPGVGVDLEEIVRDELLAQAASEDQVSIRGPDVALAPKAAEVLTLALHELATNATKYGAFSHRDGHVDIAWRVEPRDGRDWLVLNWAENGVPILVPGPLRRGFGTELISSRIPYELRGRGSFELRPGGLRSEIEFPLVPGGSILDMDGGTI
ncbi:sensor histidine kinase [Sphingomonas parva]|nr:HWE histidine kinase domain-containing protein [Sphingomonas parva]